MSDDRRKQDKCTRSLPDLTPVCKHPAQVMAPVSDKFYNLCFLGVDQLCAAEDEQFREEKGVIIKEISMLDGPSAEGQPVDPSAHHVW